MHIASLYLVKDSKYGNTAGSVCMCMEGGVVDGVKGVPYTRCVSRETPISNCHATGICNYQYIFSKLIEIIIKHILAYINHIISYVDTLRDNMEIYGVLEKSYCAKSRYLYYTRLFDTFNCQHLLIYIITEKTSIGSLCA